MSATSTDERLHRDAFPVEVNTPDGFHQRCRAFVTNQRVIVWTLIGDQPTKLIDEPYTSTQPVDRNRGSFFGQLQLETAAGRVSITKGSGCACGTLGAIAAPVGW